MGLCRHRRPYRSRWNGCPTEETIKRVGGHAKSKGQLADYFTQVAEDTELFCAICHRGLPTMRSGQENSTYYTTVRRRRFTGLSFKSVRALPYF